MTTYDPIWNNLSDFWGRLPSTDKELIEGLWSAYIDGLNAEYTQIYQIDASKSLQTCPVFHKYRWLALDLSEKNLNRLHRESGIPETSDSNLNIVHKHFRITPIDSRRSYLLPFDLSPELTEVYAAYYGASQRGDKLYFGVDYDINGRSITFSNSLPLNMIPEMRIAFNQTNQEIQWQWDRYQEYTSSSKSLFNIGASTLIDSDLGALVFVNGRWMPPDTYVLESGNSILLNDPVSNALVSIHWPYVNEVSASLTERHRHRRQEFSFNESAIGGSGSSGVALGVTISDPPDVMSSIPSDSPEFMMRVFVNGKLLPFDRWEFNQSSGLVSFNPAISWSDDESVNILVEFSDIKNDQSIPRHGHRYIHFMNIETEIEFERFDDGGFFDDGGVFDDGSSQNSLNLEIDISGMSNMRVYLQSRLLKLGLDYFIRDDNRTLFFSSDIDGRMVKIEYDRDGRQFVYGIDSRESRFSSRRIRKANMMLFYDEDASYRKEYSVDADGEYVLDSVNAARLASEDTYCHSIPVIQSSVDNPELVFTEGVHYELVDGAIASDVELPEFCWCPVVHMDEQALAKNFGVLVDYIRDGSSNSYKQELMAFWNGLLNGPIIRNIEWTVSMFLGVPFFQGDGKVVSVSSRTLHNRVNTSTGDTYIVDRSQNIQNRVGDRIFVGQSVSRSSDRNVFISMESSGSIDTTRIRSPGIESIVKPGDSLFIDSGMASGSYIVKYMEDNAILLDRPLSGSIGLIQEDVFDGTVQNSSITTRINYTKFPVIEAGSYIHIENRGTYIVKSVGNSSIELNETAPQVTSGLKFWIWFPVNIFVIQNDVNPVAVRTSVITSITRVSEWVIRTDFGQTISLPDGVLPSVSQGDSVERFQPASRQVAFYDDTERPNWYLSNRSFSFDDMEERSSTARERVVIEYPSATISNGAISGPQWISEGVRNGNVIRLLSGINTTGFDFLVTRVNNSYLWTESELLDDSNVQVQVVELVESDSDEVNRTVYPGSLTQTQASRSASASASRIQVDDASSFPDQGVIYVRDGSEGIEFIKYESIVDNTFINCSRSFYRTNDRHNAINISTGDDVTLYQIISDFPIREVFTSGVSSLSNLNSSAAISENAKILYDFIKQHSCVLEILAGAQIDGSDMHRISSFMNRIVNSSSHWFSEINKSIVDIDFSNESETITSGDLVFHSSDFMFNGSANGELWEIDETPLNTSLFNASLVVTEGVNAGIYTILSYQSNALVIGESNFINPSPGQTPARCYISINENGHD